MPFLDSRGLLHVEGCLHKSFDAKHQMILPTQHNFTKLLTQLLISSLRQKFWILSIKRVVKQIVYKCIICYRLKAATTKQLMGELPSPGCNLPNPLSRQELTMLNQTIRLGPSRSKIVSKVYIAVFVCFAT
jgi:hypothetical protein